MAVGEGHGGRGTALCPCSAVNGALGMVCAGMGVPQRGEGLQTLPKAPGCSAACPQRAAGLGGCRVVGYRTGGPQNWGDAGLEGLGSAALRATRLWSWRLRD